MDNTNLNYKNHVSVMLAEVLKYFRLNENKKLARNFADLTFGRGGHSFEICKRTTGKVISCDQDPEALNYARGEIANKNLSNQLTLIDGNFANFCENLQRLNYKEKFQGILMDLGVSSHHFDSAERGFSFRRKGPLDMRMNPRQGQSVAEWLSRANQEEIIEVLQIYGEEKFAYRIAKNIVDFRKNKTLETTDELESLVFHSYPKNLRYKRIHPSTKTFQAFRIFINSELKSLEEALSFLPNLLEKEGRLIVISFHSLEDRVVKHTFRKIVKTGEFSVLTKKLFCFFFSF